MTSDDGSTPPRWYALTQEIADRALAEQACLAVLDLVRPRIKRVCIDAYSDYENTFTTQVLTARDELRNRGALRRHGDPGMAVELDPASPADWDVLRIFAAWSIHVEIDGDEGTLAVLHDCGRSIGVALSQAEADRLSRSLPGGLRFDALDTRRRGVWHRNR